MNISLFLVYASIYIGLVATAFYMLGFNSEKKKKKLLFSDSELPTVSVIIPAYNEEKSIASTIESILSSDYPKNKFEVVVIDDGSLDKTYEIAKKYSSKIVKVFTKKNGGKGTALNFGLKKIKGEIFISMDADTFVKPNCVKDMVRYFKDPKVLAVTPSMLVHNPKGILQRVQQAEYLFGMFIRKAFSSVNAIHVTPGAFSAYRKSFTDKYGGYQEGNITEDLELSLRIQYHQGIIEYCPEAAVYTMVPNKFRELMVQRRRWYAGLMKNTWNYKKIFGRKYGDLGLFVFPMAWISIFFSTFLINYSLIDIVVHLRENYLFLARANFDFMSMYSLNSYVFERSMFHLITNPVVIFVFIFAIAIYLYVSYASEKTGRVRGILGTIGLYFLFFALLFGFWWTVSIIYVIFNKKVSWR